MHRFHLPPEQAQGDELVLSREDSHHAVRVLRVQTGGRVVVLDGAGGELACEVAAIERREVRLRVVARKSVPRLPYDLTLIQSIAKGKAMDLILQKATELGASRIVPVVTERTVSHLDDDRAETRRDKWQAICIESIKQCGSAWLPKVEVPQSLAGLMDRSEAFDFSLVASLETGSLHPAAAWQAALAKLGKRPSTVAVWVGPEGDFTSAELAAIRTSGAVPVTLGPLVLRSDTAAIYCLSLLSCALQG